MLLAGFIFGMAVTATIFSAVAMAIIRALGKRLVKFRSSWPTGLSACFIGYFVSMVFGGAWSRYHPMVTATDHVIHVLMVYGLSICIYPFLHLGISKNGGGMKPSFLQALFLGGVQVLVGLAGGLAAWYLIFFLNKHA